MCNFFSFTFHRDGRILFTEKDSHEEIIKRAGLRDGDVFLRDFVRGECKPPFDAVTVDENGTLPAWFEERRAEFEERAMMLARVVAGHFERYEAKRDTLDADYKAKRAPLDAELIASLKGIEGYLAK